MGTAQVQQPRSASGGPVRKAFPSMSATEVLAARHSWGIQGTAARAAIRAARGNGIDDLRVASSCTPGAGAELECAICMLDMQDHEDCLLLPCGYNGSSIVSQHGRPRARSMSATPDCIVGHPHVLH